MWIFPTFSGDQIAVSAVTAILTFRSSETAVRMSWGDYIRAVFRVELAQGTRWIKPARNGQPHDAIFPDSAGRPVYVITAFNPAGEVVPQGANALAHQRLETRLHEMGATYLAAAGGNLQWTHVEPSFAVIGMPEEVARALGREFGQDALFGWSPTTLTVLSCDTARVHITGWDVLPDPAGWSAAFGQTSTGRRLP